MFISLRYDQEPFSIVVAGEQFDRRAVALVTVCIRKVTFLSTRNLTLICEGFMSFVLS